MPTLSIVIPMYNAMNHIDRCLDSILDQRPSYVDGVEVIAVDDHSTDDTADHVEQIARHVDDERFAIRVIRLEENSGSGTLPRNRGIQVASGDYTLLLDSDDYLSPNVIDPMVRHAVEWRSDILLVKPVGENGRQVPKSMFHESTPKADVYESTVINKMSNWNLYRTRFLHDNRISGMHMNPCPADDWDFTLKTMLQADIVSVAADRDYLHITNADADSHLTARSVTRSYTAGQWLTFWKQIFDDLEKYADLTRIHKRVLPRLTRSDMPARILDDMFSGREPAQDFMSLVRLMDQWFDVDRIREAGGQVDPEETLILKAMHTRDMRILESAHTILDTFDPKDILNITRLKTQDKQIRKLKTENGKLKSTNDGLRKSCARLTKTNAGLTAELDSSRAEITRLRDSRSWRITAPLRRLSRMMS